MLLRFIGEDGLMGLRKGKVYACSVDVNNYCIWVSWNSNGLNNPPYPYKSFKQLFEHWEEVGE